MQSTDRDLDAARAPEPDPRRDALPRDDALDDRAVRLHDTGRPPLALQLGWWRHAGSLERRRHARRLRRLEPHQPVWKAAVEEGWQCVAAAAVIVRREGSEDSGRPPQGAVAEVEEPSFRLPATAPSRRRPHRLCPAHKALRRTPQRRLAARREQRAHRGELQRGRRHSAEEALEARAQRRVEREAGKGRDGQPGGDDAKVVVDAHVASSGERGVRVVAAREERVEARWRHEEATVGEAHLPVLEQVVERGQHVALRLFDAVEQQQPPGNGGPNGRRVYIVDVAVQHLPPLLEVGLGGVGREREALHLAARNLRPAQCQLPLLATRRPDEQHVLPERLLLRHPPEVLRRCGRAGCSKAVRHEVWRLGSRDLDSHVGHADGGSAESPRGEQPHDHYSIRPSQVRCMPPAL